MQYNESLNAYIEQTNMKITPVIKKKKLRFDLNIGAHRHTCALSRKVEAFD